MGSCIICGTSVAGHICDLHVEDVLFEFEGNHPNQLSVNRYYRGTVDGYAEFGVFVDVGDTVTGLLHRSEIDQRLDSLEWERGDEVVVKVKNVRDNGDIDLGWSIRQSAREFRGVLVDDPEYDHAQLAENESGNGSDGAGESAGHGSDGPGKSAGNGSDGARASAKNGREETTEASGNDSAGSRETGGDGDDDERSEDETGADGVSRVADADRSDRSASVAGDGTVDGGGAVASTGGQAVASETESTRVTVVDLEDHLGEDVRIEGEIADVRQTSGPTVFRLSDESGTVDCAAFVEAGVRAYPEVEEDDVVRIVGEVRERRGELQVETEDLTVLEDEDDAAVRGRIDDALEDRSRPEAVDLLADDPAVEALGEPLIEAATAIRRAVITDRPVIVRHSATADGYVAGVALERATIPLVREEHREASAEYHYFDRRPLEGGVYDMNDATRDVTTMLQNQERHDETVPLFVFVAAGGTRESVDGFDLLDVYGAPRVVLDDADADDTVGETVETLVSPALVEAPATTATALAANVAAHVNTDVRSDLTHLPAVSFWDVPPASYQEAAAEAGYDDVTVRELREAVALEAYYQSYEDKRELITDLLFGDEDTDVGGLASNIAEQFRTKMDTAVETASANLDHQDVGDATVAVLDTEAFTHRFDFPSESLLLDELFRTEVEDVDALVGIAKDTLYVRTDPQVDVHDVADAVDEAAPEAGVAVRSGREGSLRFLAGERSAVIEAALADLAERV